VLQGEEFRFMLKDFLGMHVLCIWYPTTAACAQQEAVARLAAQGGVLPAVCFKVRSSALLLRPSWDACCLWHMVLHKSACIQPEEAVARLAGQGGVLVGDSAVCFKVRSAAPCLRILLACTFCGIWCPTSAACTHQAEAVVRQAAQGWVLVEDPAVCFKVRSSALLMSAF
jgi:hypothetical protein